MTGTIPSPATTASASIVVPCFVVTDPDVLDELLGEDRDALLAVVVVDERRQIRGKERAPMPASGKTIVTAQPFRREAAATSEPMKPPPITATRTPSPAIREGRR